jgi:Uma2 family endonuclease
MPTKTLLTIAEFEKLAEKDGVRYELSEGELVEVTFPTPRHKIRQYLTAGTQAIWVVYPETREVHVLEADGTVRRLTPAHSLEAPNLLPGFSHRIASLFDE